MSEQIFEFQPVDDRGRDWGPPITISYVDDADLAEKLEAENAALVGKLASAKLRTAHEPDVPAKKYDPESSPMSQQEIEAEALRFQRETPEYQGSPAAFAALVSYMERFQLAPTAENWKLAFSALSEMRVLTKASGPVQKHVKALTIADIDRMPADLYKRNLLSDPEFAAHVEQLYK